MQGNEGQEIQSKQARRRKMDHLNPTKEGYERVVSIAEACMIANQLVALADPIRLMLISVLQCYQADMDNPLVAQDLIHVEELSKIIGLEQPTISHHLARLKDEDMVSSYNRGLFSYYYIREAQVYSALAQVLTLVNPDLTTQDALVLIDLFRKENLDDLVELMSQVVGKDILESFVSKLIEKMQDM